jgi:hypothetical protein
MKSIDLWAMLLLYSMPEKPLELEGMWRSCSSMGRSFDIEYVAEFKKDELIEDYFKFAPGNGRCEGKRLLRFQRKRKISFNSFHFKFEHQSGTDIPNPYEYSIKGGTLEIKQKKERRYLTRIEYPRLFRFKKYVSGFFVSLR